MMTKKLLLLMLTMFIFFSAGILLSRGVGAHHRGEKDDPANFFSKSVFIDGAWCWQSICPGKTTMTDVKLFVLGVCKDQNIGYNESDYLLVTCGTQYEFTVSSYSEDAQHVGVLSIATLQQNNGRAKQYVLGNIISELGPPKKVKTVGDSASFPQRWDLIFDNGVQVFLDVNSNRLTFDQEFLYILYTGIVYAQFPQTGVKDYHVSLDWQGFTTY